MALINYSAFCVFIMVLLAMKWVAAQMHERAMLAGKTMHDHAGSYGYERSENRPSESVAKNHAVAQTRSLRRVGTALRAQRLSDTR